MLVRPFHRSVRRWIPIMILLVGLLPIIATDRAPQAASAAPAGLRSADWQAIQAQLPLVQQAYLKASNPAVYDLFGYSVAVSGDTVVVGAQWEASSSSGVNSIPNEAAPRAGAAYVFIRSGSTWDQEAYLKASNPGEDDLFGWSVAVSGDTIVVGARGEANSSSGVNSIPNEAAPRAGAAYVFIRSGGTWSQEAYLKASNPETNDFFGYSVALDGAIVVIGAIGEDSSSSGVNPIPNEAAPQAGAAYVFIRSGGTWSQNAYLKASNPGGDDLFGTSVALDGAIVVIGAPSENSSSSGVNSTPNEAAESAGAAYVFTRSGAQGVPAWSQDAYLKASNPGVSDGFGMSVAASGDTVVIGAYYEASSSSGINSIPNEAAPGAGAAYVFVRSGAQGAPVWRQDAYLKASNPGADDYFGMSVAVSNDTIVVGAPQENSSSGGNAPPNEAAPYAGAAYVFVRSGAAAQGVPGAPAWSQDAYLKASNPGGGDLFGTSVAVNNETILIGAPQEDSSTSGVNAPPNEAAESAGAAYVFAVPAARLYLPLLTR